MDQPDLPDEPLTVLVADDIAASRDALGELVRSLGHACLTAASGEEALRCIEGHQPDVVLLDLWMPGIDGFEVVRQVRQRVTGKWLPLVVTSSLDGDEHFVHAMSMGADDYLVRPVRPVILRAKLSHYQRVLALQNRQAVLARRQRAIHEHIADAIITVDASGRICEVNLAAQKLFGASSSAELVNQPVAEVCGVGLAQLLVTREIAFTRGDGQVVPLGISASEWSIATKPYCTVSLHDLSEWRRIERMKDEFLATVSHELRTPLTSVLGALGLLGAGAAGALPGPAQELIAVARRNGERLTQLIDDVLDLTKLEGNRMVLNLRPAALDALLTEAMAANAAYAQRGGVNLQYECLAQGAQAVVDADRFLQVMANLLSNAVKHSRSGQTVRVSLYGDPGGWRIDVIDQGPGIDPAFRDRLFEKFSQADGADNRPQGGTGLGLYISRMFVERMGGRIFAQSRAGQGATFSLNFPRRTDEQAARWLLCIARDHQQLARLGQWLAPLGRVEMVADASAAQALVARVGSPAAVIADPRAQGSADDFCRQLRMLAAADAVLLVGDAIDSGFAHKHQLAWLPLAGSSSAQLQLRLQAMLAPPELRIPHG